MPLLTFHSLVRSTVCGGSCLCLLAGPPATSSAQSRHDARASAVVAGGIAQLPDALSSQCGTRINGAGSDAEPEIGAGFLFRPLRWMVILADTRLATGFMFPRACLLIAPPVDTNVSRTGTSFATSTLRVGVETPLGKTALLRLSGGSGFVWGAPRLPLTVLTAGWSTRGNGKRFFAEMERAQTRLRGTETHNVATPSFTQPIVLRPVVYTVRVGLEVPLR
jgi:hypothetical protein